MDLINENIGDLDKTSSLCMGSVFRENKYEVNSEMIDNLSSRLTCERERRNVGQRETLRVAKSLECGNEGDPVDSREILMVGERYYVSRSRVSGSKGICHVDRD